MNLKQVSDKIQHTRVFTDAQKVKLLVELVDASQEDIEKLGDGIDAFDREYKISMEKQSREIIGLLTSIMKDMPEDERRKNQDAVDDIIMGTALLQPVS